MENEGLPNSDLEIRAINSGLKELERDSDVSTTLAVANHPMQTKFRVVIEKGTLSAAPPIQRELSYFEWSIVTDPTDIDGSKEYCSDQNLDPGADSMENIDDGNADEPFHGCL